MQQQQISGGAGILPGMEGHQENRVMEWPRVFKEASQAVTFADALLNDPGLGSQLEFKKMASGHNHATNPEKYATTQDLAETITVELSRCKKPASNLYRYVYGKYRDYEQILGMADKLAHNVWTGPGAGKAAEKKTIAQCRDLALLLMEKTRQRERFNKRLTMTSIAKEMKISRQQLYEQWIEEISGIEAGIKQNLDITDHALSQRLEMLQII